MEDICEKEDETETAETKNSIIFSGPSSPPKESCTTVTHKLLRETYQVNMSVTNIISAQRMEKYLCEVFFDGN